MRTNKIYKQKRASRITCDLEAYDETKGPVAVLTKCMSGSYLKKNKSYIDENNSPWAVAFLEENGIAQIDRRRTMRSGYCAYPLAIFDEKIIKNLEH